jgi:hypothetical protein
MFHFLPPCLSKASPKKIFLKTRRQDFRLLLRQDKSFNIMPNGGVGILVVAGREKVSPPSSINAIGKIVYFS